MKRVARYRNELHANLLAEELKSRGIPAVVVSPHTQHVLGFGAKFMMPWDGSEVYVPTHREFLRAQDVLAEMANDAEPAAITETPHADLARVDPDRFPIDCPACNASLPLDNDTDRCPSCKLAVDLEYLLVERHGPEALTDAYPDDTTPPWTDDTNATTPPQSNIPPRRDITLPQGTRCEACRADLSHQPLAGRCPHCGQLYDRRDPFPGAV